MDACPSLARQAGVFAPGELVSPERRFENQKEPQEIPATGGLVPITVQNLLATLYHLLGVAPGTTFLDHLSRPQTLFDEQGKITALL